MKKIPTIFKRDEKLGGHIVDERVVSLDLLKTGIATEKIDGTNVRVTVRNHTSVRLEKRCNPTKLQKAKGIIEPWYIDASTYEAGDKWIVDALNNTDLSNIPDGEWSGEAVGVNIQGNPLNLDNNRIVFFTLGQCPVFENTPVTFEELKEWLPKQKSKYGNNCGIEGIVWHFQNGEMAKIKTKDFK